MNILGELGIIKDHIHFRIIKRTRPLSIHTECLHKDNVWAAAQHFVDSGRKAIWFVVTTANYDFVKAESGCMEDAKELERTVAERYKWLQAHGQQIELHVHLRVKMELYDSGREAAEDIRRKITDGVSWLKSNGFNPKEIVFGWWSSDKTAEDFAAEQGLRTVRRLDYYFIHDYDLLDWYGK